MGEPIARYDIEGMARELETDLETIAGLYASYIEEMGSETAAMEDCLAQSDWYMLERVVHNIKGVSANLGISDVFEAARDFDDLLKQDNTADAAFRVHDLKRLIEGAEIEIKRFFENNGLPIKHQC